MVWIMTGGWKDEGIQESKEFGRKNMSVMVDHGICVGEKLWRQKVELEVQVRLNIFRAVGKLKPVKEEGEEGITEN